MHIAFHIGANCTDEDRLLKSILKNVDALLQQGIAVPGPSKYRKLIRETIQALDGGHPRPGTRDILIDAITEDEDVSRLVLSNDNFIAVPKRIFDHDTFYPQAETKVRGLHQLFPDDDVSLYLGLRNPASFLQDVVARAEPPSLAAYLGQLAPTDLLWSDVIWRIKLAAPHTPLIVWCNEDTPLIWEELIRLQSGVADDTAITGQHDLLSGIVSAEGMRALEKRLTDDAVRDRSSRQEIIADILENYARPEASEEEIKLPGLDADTVARMTENHEADLIKIAKMDGVSLIEPFT